MGGDFSLAQATNEKPVTRRLHIGFAAPSRTHVDEFWRAGTEAGYRDDGTRAATQAGYRDNGAPGERAVHHAGYYGAYVVDADGNNIEVVNHNR